MLAWISVLWIVINNPEITTVAQKNRSFLLSLSQEDVTCNPRLLSHFLKKKKKKLAVFLASRMCFPFYFLRSVLFSRLSDLSVADCQLVSVAASVSGWVSFRAPVSSLSVRVASTSQSLSSHTSH